MTWRPLRLLLGRPTTRRLAYLAVCLPLGIGGFVAAAVLVTVGSVLTVTPLGLWIIALTLRGAQALGGLYRRLAAALLGETIETPPVSRRPGLLNWRRAVLGDPAAWRALGHVVVKLPLSLAGFSIAGGAALYGPMLALYPLLRTVNAPAVPGAGGETRHALSVGGVVLDSGPAMLLVSAAGIALTVVMPRVTARVAAFDLACTRALLAPSEASRRISALEHSRAAAVGDADALLRVVERNLHDGAQVRLVALIMQLAMAKEFLQADEVGGEDLKRLRELVDTARAQAGEAVTELRELVRGIRPPALDDGLETAVASLVARSGLRAALTVRLPEPPAPAVETIAYFCAAELITNVLRHAHAGDVAIDISQPDGLWLRMRVTDDGRGGARQGKGTGLAGLSRRLAAVDGTLLVVSPEGGPTEVTVDIPREGYRPAAEPV
jgi:signal transduction histidine kinase